MGRNEYACFISAAVKESGGARNKKDMDDTDFELTSGLWEV